MRDVEAAQACLEATSQWQSATTQADHWQRLGSVQSALGRHSAAALSLGRASRLDPNSDRLHALGVLFEATGALPRAARAYALAVRLNPGSVRSYFALGFVLGRAQRGQQARSAFGAALTLDPTDARSYRALGLADTLLKRHASAATALHHAVRLQPTFGDAWFELGIALQQTAELPAALRAYRALLVLSPRNAPALANRGTVLRELARPAEAAASYTAALAAAPAFPEVLNNLGLVAAQELAQPDRALRLVAAGRKLAPRGADWATVEGLALTRMQRYTEAATAFGHAARVSRGSSLTGRPSADAACQLLLARKRIADWRSAEALLGLAVDALRSGGCDRSWDKLYGLALPLDPPLLRMVAERYAQRKEQIAQAIGAPRRRWPIPVASRCGMRVGYMSADIRWHVMAFLTQARDGA